MAPGTSTRSRRRGWYALLLLPYGALLCIPLYARRDPELLGFPFFYWYQFAWGVLTIALTAAVYRVTRPWEADAGTEP